VRTLPLTEIPPRDLRALLRLESGHWRGELLWDFSDVSAAVATGVERRALFGWAALDAGRPVAYGYGMPENGRVVVGSIFAAPPQRGQGVEELLLELLLRDAREQRGDTRVECQTLFSTAPGIDQGFARAGFASAERHYLVRPLPGPLATPGHRFRLRAVRRGDLPRIAEVIYLSHAGSLDAALNLTYATPGLCRGFVENLVLRSACGRFDPEGSFVAEGPSGPAGVILASRLSGTNGHICQVSVLPQGQGHGLGRALLGATLQAFQRAGLQMASLSVTVGNARAYRLYLELGFRLRRSFAAHAWVRPPASIRLPA
jgi:ribosomal protein S18 acetylase RimI-like enzyme